MTIFLDTADPKLVATHLASGVIRGVTTNPSIFERDTAVQDWPGVKAHSGALAEQVCPFPISLEVMSEDPESMVKQGQQLASLANNVAVKVPVHSADGTTSFLPVIRQLASEGITVNATAAMTAQQCLLAAMSGARFVSILAGRLGDQGLAPEHELGRLRRLIDSLSLEAKIIAASTRHPGNVCDWLDAGAHIVTVRPSVLEQMLFNPGTKDIVTHFMADADRLKCSSM